MRNGINEIRDHDPRINYRGLSASRLENLTDAVFGIAITLLIFNLTNPNSFGDLITFTKTLPAFLISITFLVLIWNEHLQFAQVYTLNDSWLITLNTLFLALVIFYVYPLRFLMLFLTNFFFQTEVDIAIQGDQVPLLMIYYGFVAFALYFTLFLFFYRVLSIKEKLGLSPFELFHTRAQQQRLIIMFTVPVISIIITAIIYQFSFVLASIVGGITYALYTPAIMIWHRRFKRKSEKFSAEEAGTTANDD
jgi:uncharacterized membrane protein